MHPAVTPDGGGQVSDEALAAAGVRGDPEVFTEVYDRYFRAIYLYVAGRLGTGPAEDIAAETFAVAFGQRDRFDPTQGGLRPWLFGIATNLVARPIDSNTHSSPPSPAAAATGHGAHGC